MNLNVKLEGEEEQTLQYVNRFAINIPSGATTFNLNIVNPGLSNQSYILNPVNPVGQNIVAYQQPMAVQSYIALPTEGEGNIIHSLPVGVPVPVGLPVPTGLLQNHNFVNTSIILGNEDCNSSGVLKTSSNDLNSGNKVKINYVEKQVEEISNNGINPIEIQNLELNHSPQLGSGGVVKKPCPLEMSIKAANIDMEFDRCEAEVGMVQETRIPQIGPQFKMPSGDPTKPSKVPLTTTSSPNIKAENNDSAIKQLKTEITWDNNNVKSEVVSDDFQESLICEVEEVNDEDEDEEMEGEEEEESSGKFDSKSNQYLSSSGESDTLPLSVALKLNKLPNNKKNKKVLEKDKVKRKRSHKHKKQKGENEEEEEEEWSESDDDALNTKRIKNEYNYKCVYEPESTKSETVLVLKIDDKSQKFARVRICCSKKECGKKISVKDQKTAFKNFYDLESNLKRDAYLMNCIEHVQKTRQVEKENTKDKTYKTGGAPDEKKMLVNENIQLEIENESNGNQKLSDEIQNAIQESLKDCLENETKVDNNKSEAEVEAGEKMEKNSWNFYLVIDRCRRRVCLQFLLKLFHITKNKIKQLQKKILSGTPLAEDNSKSDQKPSEVWEMAKLHLSDLGKEECVDCSANPRHRLLSHSRTRQDLFVNFKKYCVGRTGKEPNIKYKTYKRFLDKDTTLSFTPRREGVCAECEELKKHPKRKQNKTTKSKEKMKEDSKEATSDDDEPLMKRKKLKLTIALKSVKQNLGKRNGKNPLEKKKKGKSKEKGKQSMSKGRDVWSLMLLHLETMPYKECSGCVSKKKHRFLDPTFTTQGLFEDYRKYFLKETNSELGLGFTMYEKYFIRNCNYTISDVDVNSAACPRCANDGPKS